MSTPQPPEPWGQAWSEGSATEHRPIGNPPTQQFTTPQYPGEQYPGQPNSDAGYQEQQFPGQQYSESQYPDQQYPGQAYPPGAENAQYYAQPPPPGYGPPGYAPPPPSRTPGWAWALLAVVIIGLLGGGGYLAASQLLGSNEAPSASSPSARADSTAPQAVTPSARPSTSAATTTPRAPQASLPGNAIPCPGTQRTAEFSSSAVVGNTSCPFAEEVRMAYLQQPQRGGAVSVQAWSPVTKRNYTMTCSGEDVVKCAGGDNAVVYVY